MESSAVGLAPLTVPQARGQGRRLGHTWGTRVLPRLGRAHAHGRYIVWVICRRLDAIITTRSFLVISSLVVALESEGFDEATRTKLGFAMWQYILQGGINVSVCICPWFWCRGEVFLRWWHAPCRVRRGSWLFPWNRNQNEMDHAAARQIRPTSKHLLDDDWNCRIQGRDFFISQISSVTHQIIRWWQHQDINNKNNCSKPLVPL